MDLAAPREAASVLDERQADAFPARLLGIAVPALVGRALLDVAGFFDRALQNVARPDALPEDLAGRRDGAFPEGVFAAKLQGVPARLLGDFFPVELRGEKGLGGAEAAEGAVGGGVGGQDRGVDADVGAFVGAGRVDRAPRQDDGGERDVGAAVHHDLDILGEEPSVAGEPGFVAHDRGMAFRGRGHVLRTVVDDLDGAAGLAGEDRRVPADHVGVFLLAAEAAAGRRLDHADLAVGEPEKPLHRLVDVVGALQGARHRQGAVFPPGGHGVVFDVGLLLVRDAVFALDDDVGFPEALVDVAAADDVALKDVVRAVEDLASREGILDREDGRKLLVFDADESEGLIGPRAAFVRDEGDGLQGVAHHAVGQERLVVLDQGDDVRGDVPGGRHDALGPGEGGVEDDVLDPPAGDFGADGDAEEAARDVVVVEVERSSGELLRALVAPGAPPHGWHEPIL